MNQRFDFHEAFCRNLGWVTALELDLLRGKRVAIAGVGGVHLLTLARLGIGAFNIADMDVFELANFNRQAGAMMSTLGRPKVEVMAAMARDINPELDIRIFPEGIGPDNFDDFLRDVDLYVDGLDVFALDVRAAIFAACGRLGLPAITVAPLGMSAALVNFLPGKMSFADYFGFAGASEMEKMARFLVGLSPRAMHRHYLVDPQRVDLANQRSASTPMSCQLCAGVAATEALKILLGRGKVYAAPHAISYDAYLIKQVRTWRPGGYRNPLNRLMVGLALRFMARPAAPIPHAGKTRDEIAVAYRSPPWWYDIRGFFVLTFAYNSTIGAQLRFFGPHFGRDHIEIACGTGTLLDLLLRWRRWKKLPVVNITGIDYAESMLAGAQHRFAGNDRVTLRHADAAKLPFADQSFDTANIANAIHCLPEVDAALKDMFRVLKPGGTLAANVLLYPRGVWPLKRIAERVNAWGIRKGILYTPYERDDIRRRIVAAGFEVVVETQLGNTYNLVARRPAPAT